MTKKRNVKVGAISIIMLVFIVLISCFAINVNAEDAIFITYDANGSVFSDTNTQVKKQKLEDALIYPSSDIVPYLVIPEKWEFLGWSENKNDVDGAPWDLFCPDNDLTLYAIWKKYDVQVTFDAGKGFFDEDKDKHSIVALTNRENREWSNYPSTPQWINGEKVFDGWYKTKDCSSGEIDDPWDYEYKEDTTLYAKWEDAITITYDFNGGTSWNGDKTYSYPVAKGGEISVWESYGKSPKPNQIISAWYDNKDLKGLPLSDYASFDEDTTLYAKWVDTWVVTIDMGEGQMDGYDNSYHIEKGKSRNISVHLAKNPLENGKYYAGIYTGPNGTGEPVDVYTETEPQKGMWDEEVWSTGWFTYTPTNDTTLYAYWAEPITITFDANGGVLSGNKSTDVYKTLPGYQIKDGNFGVEDFGAKRDGYTFIGWSTDKDGKQLVDKDAYIKQSTTLYAVWGDGFTVTYDANGGAFWDDTTTRIYTIGAGNAIDHDWPSSITSPQKKKVFASWYYDKDCKNEVDSIYSLVPDKDLTLYAGWSDGVKITYNANGGYFYTGEDENKTTTSDTYIIKGSRPYLFRPDGYPSGKEFAGYYYDQKLTKQVEADDTFVADTVLYAKWVDSVVLTLDANGGYFPWEDSDKKSFNVSSSDPIEYYKYGFELIERDGFIFAGWYYDKDTTRPFDPNKEGIVLNKDTTIYAKWMKGYPKIEVSYYIGNTKVDSETAYVDENGKINDYAVHYHVSDWLLNYYEMDPTKQGIDTDWYLDKALTRPFTDTMIESPKIKVYGKIVDRHQLRLYLNDGSLYTYDEDDDAVYVNDGVKLSDTLLNDDVYHDAAIHVGWTSEKGSKKLIDLNQTAKSDLTLHEVVDPAYKVTFDANGGYWDTGRFYGITTELLVAKGKTLSEGIKDYYSVDADQLAAGYYLYHYGDKLFKGWYEDKALTKPVPNLLEYVPTSDTTLYAKWERYGEVAPTPTEPTTKPTEPTTKPSEPTTNPTEPTTKPTEKPTEPTTKTDGGKASVVLNGLVKGSDGKWAMYKANQVQTSYNGLAKNENGWYDVKNGYVAWDYTGFDKNLDTGIWWRVKNGRVDFTADGIYKKPENGIWYKTTGGKVTFNETGVFKNENGWWRVKDSRVDFNANGIYKNKNGWWKTTNGKVTFKENGVFKNENGWWKVENSKVNFNFTGIASNKNGTWYLKGGKVDFSKNGKVTYNGKTYTVKNGKVQ